MNATSSVADTRRLKQARCGSRRRNSMGLRARTDLGFAAASGTAAFRNGLQIGASSGRLGEWLATASRPPTVRSARLDRTVRRRTSTRRGLRRGRHVRITAEEKQELPAVPSSHQLPDQTPRTWRKLGLLLWRMACKVLYLIGTVIRPRVPCLPPHDGRDRRRLCKVPAASSRTIPKIRPFPRSGWGHVKHPNSADHGSAFQRHGRTSWS